MIEQYIQIASGVSTLAVIVFLAWDRRKTGVDTINSETTQGYKDRDELRKETITNLTTELVQVKADKQVMKEGFIRDLTELRTQNKNKDEKIVELQATVENRNPNLERILTELVETNKEIRNFMRSLAKDTTHQTEMIEGQVKRDNKQDVATNRQKGLPILKELP